MYRWDDNGDYFAFHWQSFIVHEIENIAQYIKYILSDFPNPVSKTPNTSFFKHIWLLLNFLLKLGGFSSFS